MIFLPHYKWAENNNTKYQRQKKNKNVSPFRLKNSCFEHNNIKKRETPKTMKRETPK